MGVIQAIISFFQDGDDTLKCFSAGKHRFAVVAEGPLYLVAISSMGESDSQVYKFRSSISLDHSFPGKYTHPSLRPLLRISHQESGTISKYCPQSTNTNAKGSVFNITQALAL